MLSLVTALRAGGKQLGCSWMRLRKIVTVHTAWKEESKYAYTSAAGEEE